MQPPSAKHIRRLTLPAAWLLLLLERTPALRIASAAAEYAAPSRIGALLRAAFATTASLGTVHALAGATQFVVSNSNVFGTVGTPITPIAFTVTGAAIPPGSFRIVDPLPPGLSAPNANANGILNGDRGTITGTPTRSGTYIVSILAFERANASGDAFGPTEIGFIITDTAATVPTFTTHPVNQSAAAGTTVTLSVVVSANPSPAFQWRKNGTLVSGATSSTLTLSNIQPSDAGSYTAIASNVAGLVTSNPAVLTVTAGAPVLTTQPQSQHVAPGGNVTFTVATSGAGLTYQWLKGGIPIAGANGTSFTVPAASASSMGFYSVAVSSATGATQSNVAILTVNTAGSSRLINVSTRGLVPAGGTFTQGFVLQGSANKALVVRAVGPTLATFGVSGTLADPILDVIPAGSSTPVSSNDNWGGGSALVSAFSRVGAFPLAAAGSSDASLVTSLPATGVTGYTVRITSRNTAVSGIALAEVYDEESLLSPVRLLNVSTNGYVGTADQALVPGFVIGGDAPKQVLIRAVGPGLAQFGVTGVLANPQFSLVPLGREFAIVANDNWGGAAALQTAFAQAGAFALPSTSNDAAVVVRLPPGGYTVVVSGVNATTGTALVEVYDLDP